ncbi:MAG: sodium:alanine symporter family protein, partial [Clostridiales bacterium]|nr:sodium:alanine symporter family protein [Clostridiales bacterium]
MNFSEVVSKVDDFVWGPVMLVLLVGTGVYLTIRTGFLPWRNLPYALKST